MKSNCKLVRDLIKQHILESVTDDDYYQFDTYQQAAKHLYSEFDRVANYGLNLQRFPNNQNRFIDYMHGLPFNFEYMTSDICKFIDTLDLNVPKKAPTDEATEKLYYYLIYSEMMKEVK